MTVDLPTKESRMKVSAVVVAGLLSFPFASVSAQGVNDAQIASIVVTANQVDIDAGKLAVSRSTDGDSQPRGVNALLGVVRAAGAVLP
jgi:hypothetical protein